MSNSEMNPEHDLERILQRSNDLHNTIIDYLTDATFDDSLHVEACLAMCSLSLEHAAAVRTLIETGHPTSAAAMSRLQFEATTRAMWILYVEDEQAIGLLTAPLTKESEKAAKKLPSTSEMIDQIGRSVGTGTPAAAHEMLVHYKKALLPALHSFVHGAFIHFAGT